MIIPKINKYQKQILVYLYSFRYFTIKQLAKLFNHKDPHRVKIWLQDLAEKKLIAVIKDKKNPTIPYVFCLDTKARHILQEDENLDKNFLGRLYREKNYSEEFRNHCLFLVDIFLYFLSKKEKGQDVEFFTRTDLIGYNYFPEEMPDAYITVTSKEETERYFLDLFDDYRKAPFLPRKRIKDYIKYSEGGDWPANTGNTTLPTILFVLSSEKIRKHIFHYGKAVLEKSFEEVSVFLTTQEHIKLSKNDLWQSVE